MRYMSSPKENGLRLWYESQVRTRLSMLITIYYYTPTIQSLSQ